MSNFNVMFLLGHPFSGAEFLAECLQSVPMFKRFNELDALAPSIESMERELAASSTRYCSVVLCGHTELNSIDKENEISVLDWIIRNQIPVVHLIRENTVDSLVAKWFDSVTVPLTAETAIQEISSMRAETENIRNQLANSRCLELQFEQLSESNGLISSLAVHQISRLIGFDIDLQRCQNARLPSRSQSRQQDRLKLLLRPDLVKRGYGKLFDLPRAA